MVDVKLDDRMAFYEWVNSGSLEKASKSLEAKGIYNPNTGLAFHPGSIKQASNRFILHHVEEARKVYTEQGSLMNEKQWEVRLLLSACKVFSKKNFIIWIKENVWAYKYPQFIERRFPGLVDVMMGEGNLSDLDENVSS
jgi:hypothetical protein